MITLDRITLREIHLPLVEPFRAAHGVVSVRRILLLELVDADRTVAWSECVADALPTYSPDTVDTCWLSISEWIAPLVLGTSFDTPQAVDALLEERVRGHRMARAAVEMGTWAIAAMQAGQSLAALLTRDVAPRRFVETGIALGMHAAPDALAERVQSAVASGYRRVKLKIEPGRDVAFVRAARDALGDLSVLLSVDANCSYSLHDAAHMRAFEELDTLGLAMIEQPLGHDDLVDHAELQRRMRTPLCLDESITSVAACRAAIALGAARVVNLKSGRVGGFAEALRIHDVCASAALPVWCGGMLESGVGRASNVALASLHNFTLPGDLSPSARYWERDIVTPAWTMDAHGSVRVPLDRPGLGVDVDVGFVDQLTVRSTVLRAGADRATTS